ncbi:hypothetical protein HG535_0A01400 [Zygotorulaspora mrakii]|uniref:Uncharacterized protein n=1 Tax=Zygotorulaspora mrakii TaxID=42260 RepID=A0A7H9AX92_ZYGMR|nr:uncharacterized protein HG535_0A01400 [Zygotorulaspora mrakii]QLG70202.1 hypothetical protein HG535_0A01400 [Zygotorulaspora mrakii]
MSLRYHSITKSFLFTSSIRTYSNLPTGYTKPHALLLKLITEDLPLTSESKKYFREYWRKIIPENQILPENTLLNTIPIKTFATFIQNYKKKSSTVRAAYRKELLLNYIKNPENVRSLLTNLGFTFKENFTSDEILSISIMDSLRTGDVNIAADLYLLYYKLFPNAPLNKKLCSYVISALAFENPKFDHIHLLKFLLLYKLFKSYNTHLLLSEIQIVTLCNKALSLENSPILIKEVLSKLMDIELISTDPLRKSKLISAYHLIETDYKINNAAGVLLTWANIKNEYNSITKHDPRILHIIMKIFTHNKAYRKNFKELFDHLTPEYYCNNPLILPSIIDFATKTNDLIMAKKVMNNANKYVFQKNSQVVLFSKRCLSSLLRMHLKFKDSQGVDRVLKQILEIFGKHSEENLFAIISHLLSIKTLENFNKAIKLVNSIPQERALLSYGAIINKMVEWQIASNGKFDQKSMPLMNELLSKAHTLDPYHKNSLWTIVASLFIKKIVHRKNLQKKVNPKEPSKMIFNTTCLDLARLIYKRSNSTTLSASKTDHNPFTNSSPQRILLKLTNNNKVVILRNIASSAIKGKRKDIFLWCCSELYENGIPITELVLGWNMMLKHRFRFTQFPNKSMIEEDLSINGLPIISKALK